ncbi:MAG: hypothetical protein VKK42_26395 [Lyngbya sp.]|nr:hypothetical protein [Lyngbya sp.]
MNYLIRFLGDRTTSGRRVKLANISVTIDSGVADSSNASTPSPTKASGSDQIPPEFA